MSESGFHWVGAGMPVPWCSRGRGCACERVSTTGRGAARSREVPEASFRRERRGVERDPLSDSWTIFLGISMYALAKLFELVIGWSFHGPHRRQLVEPFIV